MTEQCKAEFKYEQCTKEELEQLRNIPLATILGVRNTGRQQNVVCPFHGDTSPSMTIYPNDNSYYCHGCGIHGIGAIDFLLESGATFVDVINELKNL